MELEQLITYLAGILITLLFAYVPGVKAWYESQDTIRKRQVIGLSSLIAAIILVGVACLGIVDIGMSCDKAGIFSLLVALGSTFVEIAIASQGTYLLTSASSKQSKLGQARG